MTAGFPWTDQPLDGRISQNASLRHLTWFRTGGAADWLFEPASEQDLVAFMAGLPKQVPLTILGTGANVLVRDGGIEGVVLRLGKAFQTLNIQEGMVQAGGALSNAAAASEAGKAALTGLEFLRGVPGTIGGAVAMNAGAYHQQISDTLISVRLIKRDSQAETVLAADLELSYRHASLPLGSVIVEANFACQPHDALSIAHQMQRVLEEREQSQPLKTKTGGSTFKNPPGDKKAWELIDAAGCRGLRQGGAHISQKHCNFMIADDGASAKDIEALGETVRQRVLDAFGVELEWEIRRLGRREASE